MFKLDIYFYYLDDPSHLTDNFMTLKHSKVVNGSQVERGVAKFSDCFVESILDFYKQNEINGIS